MVNSLYIFNFENRALFKLQKPIDSYVDWISLISTLFMNCQVFLNIMDNKDLTTLLKNYFLTKIRNNDSLSQVSATIGFNDQDKLSTSIYLHYARNLYQLMCTIKPNLYICRKALEMLGDSKHPANISGSWRKPDHRKSIGKQYRKSLLGNMDEPKTYDIYDTHELHELDELEHFLHQVSSLEATLVNSRPLKHVHTIAFTS